MGDTRDGCRICVLGGTDFVCVWLALKVLQKRVLKGGFDLSYVKVGAFRDLSLKSGCVWREKVAD